MDYSWKKHRKNTFLGINDSHISFCKSMTINLSLTWVKGKNGGTNPPLILLFN